MQTMQPQQQSVKTVQSPLHYRYIKQCFGTKGKFCVPLGSGGGLQGILSILGLAQ